VPNPTLWGGLQPAAGFSPPYNLSVPHQVTLIPGDGIGPEVAAATVRAVEATGARIAWEQVELNAKVIQQTNFEIPQPVLDSIERTKTGLKGPITTPVAGGHVSLNVQLRRKFGLFANFRPVKSFPGIKTRFSDVYIDLVIFRENTEDLYSGLEHEVVPDVVTSLKVITRVASERIARYAFTWARRNGRHKVAAVHKANIMKLGDGLFLTCCREAARDFPDLAYKELIVDNAAMQLVMRPETFDVLVMPNLYGDIVSDLAAGLVGGLGIVPGANLGANHAVFEAVHGSAPDIAGKNVANPTALMQSAVLMLNHLGESEAARGLQAAIEWVYAEGKHTTPDVGGKGTTTEFTDAVVKRLESGK
jgi:isocitrate dehydrogenase (NAD+)